MKTYLLPKEGTFYKANLHCHTNLSDGRLTPEEIKELYKNNGYSIVAYSDHDALFCNYHLTDEDFVALTAYETSVRCGNFGGLSKYNFAQKPRMYE